MIGRLPRILAPLALAPLLALTACGSGSTAPAKPGPNVGTALNGKVPASVRNLPFVDPSGHTHRLSDFAGKVVVLNDSMTLCQESCPMDTATLVDTARKVDAAGEGKKVVFLTVTVDPVRDTRAQMAAYRKQYAGPANWLVLTGTPAHVHALWKYLGVWTHKVPSDKPAPRNWRTGKPLTYDIQHSDETFFFDRHGHERFVLEGMPHVTRQGDVPAKIRRFLSDNGRKNLARAGDWSVPQALQVTGWLLGHRIR